MEIKTATRLLFKSKKTIAIAESCTGGLISHTLTNVSGSSAFFIAGLVVYSNRAKTKLLRISPKKITRYGAVSREVAIAMAKGVRALFCTDIGIAVTGIAGPGGGSRQKPVGTVYMAISTPQTNIIRRLSFKGSRLTIKKKTASQALLLLQESLKKEKSNTCI